MNLVGLAAAGRDGGGEGVGDGGDSRASTFRIFSSDGGVCELGLVDLLTPMHESSYFALRLGVCFILKDFPSLLYLHCLVDGIFPRIMLYTLLGR